MARETYRNRTPRSKKEEYLDDISFTSSQNIDIASTSNQSRFATITVSQTPQEVKVGNEILPERHSVEIINDSSFLVYFGLSEDMQVGVDAILVNSGSAATINTNPNKPVRIWVVAPDIDVEIKIAEVS